MDILTRIAALALDVIEALPRRRVPRLVRIALAVAFIAMPAFMLDVVTLRVQPLIDRILEALVATGSGG